MPDGPEDLLLPVLRQRWSPQVWDAHHQVSDAQVRAMLEAARWAPSAGNSQPWAFIVGRRGDDQHRRMCSHLAGSSARWAPDASALVVTLYQRYVEDTDWAYSDYAAYDLGQAVAHLTIQAQHMGLHTRQFAAFDHDAMAAEFAVAPHWAVTTMVAVGVVPEGVRPHAPWLLSGGSRERKSLDEITRSGRASAGRR